MSNLEHFAKDPQAAALLKNGEKLQQLRDAPETQKLFSMLSQRVEGDLEQAAQQAAAGNPQQLTQAIRQLMQSPEGARLMQQMKEKLK